MPAFLEYFRNEKDYCYQMGKRAGIAEGKIRGRLAGKLEGRIHIAIKMKQKGIDPMFIKEITEFSAEEVEAWCKAYKVSV